MVFFTARYSPELVAASLLIASLASYVTLDLAKRVRSVDATAARTWWMGGSVAMGTGIWSMHFVGMFAYTLPIELGYRGMQTLLSWLAAVLVSAVALGLASRGRLSLGRLAAGALSMGLGICAMHYIGMAALDLSPGIVWDWAWVAASALIAVGASAVALLIFFWLRQVSSRRSGLYQVLAAVVMGLAISGMHYSGMAAAQFPEGTVCLSVNELRGDELSGLVMVATLLLLGLTLFTSTLDARAQSKAVRLAASLQDANSQLQSANAELRRRAFLDPLTDLPNRLLFEDRLQHALSRCEREEPRVGSPTRMDRVAVLCIDLDGFKPVNDSFGHAAGDEVLRQVAQRLAATARERDTVARIGGDEFVLLMEDVPSMADCAALALRLLKALAEPISALGHPLQISASIGIAVFPEHGEADKLMIQADAAMYSAKRAGGNTYAVFESHMDANAQEQLSLQLALRQAISGGKGEQLALYYQPKFDAARGQIRGAEALLRWHHPERGMVPPDVFIPIAERFGLINELGNWVIDESCRQLQAWESQGLHMRLSINLSVHQLRQPDLVDRIDQALQRHGIAAARLLCEITESVAMEDIKTTQRAFEGLSRLGVFLSIDDFGTGYSSLSYLRQLPARQLKIDRSFIQDLELSLDARAVVDGVIKLAHALGLSVVAEGVETVAQRDILVELSCNELQGYLFAKPMPAQDLSDWARGQGPADGAEFSPSIYEGRP
ncbi:bifunctional diguanylate cyclase/phosphodiesterase [Paucibacter sp. KBW04]|uniref:putative bifunctional diguanylate cyclase/phosphodiesterase n=1 Tax=Paucibacter sp. KBW04 TaxID=2153361 RepID=UPI000F5785F9|nr:bifunctional diguanylate cyclase/phosphodiesterase [Paucibacter sp. KBW04]RQO55552.1 bifunctional diguanylate cyclase/phosphodiesterase [Paucibacter sp. KBW04]